MSKEAQKQRNQTTLGTTLWEQGIRHPLSAGVRRHDWKATHGFRNSTNQGQNRL